MAESHPVKFIEAHLVATNGNHVDDILNLANRGDMLVRNNQPELTQRLANSQVAGTIVKEFISRGFKSVRIDRVGDSGTVIFKRD